MSHYHLIYFESKKSDVNLHLHYYYNNRPYAIEIYLNALYSRF
jgi:hypothetical protein